MNRHYLIQTFAILALLAPQAAVAQGADAATATAEELQSVFQRQKSRGLKLAPETGLSATAVAAGTGTGIATEVVTAGAATTVETAPAVQGDAVAAVAAPVLVAYQEIDPEDQVNIRIAFDFDSAVLRDSEKPKLSTLCTAMKAVDVEAFRIVGHTDAAGTDAYNERLSLLRAEEVKRHLVSVCGLDPARLQAVGVGKRYLYNSDDPRSEENRRVEFQALS